jgi:hypothetical protein
MLEGYTLDETCARHGWTRNRGVTPVLAELLIRSDFPCGLAFTRL